MKDQPLVSIICGYYNRESMVDDSVQSLIDQTYKNLEIIIFDDCSTDHTYEKLKKFEEIDSRVKIIRHERNIGFTNGLINAINQSNGDYYAIHGSGDISYPQRIQKQLELIMSDNSISVVSCLDKRSIFRGKQSKLDSKIVNKKFLNLMLNSGRMKLSIAILVKKEYYDHIGGYRNFFVFAQDADLLCRLSLLSNYANVPEVLYEQKVMVEGSVSGTPIKRAKQIFYITFAKQCMMSRMKLGFDFIDLLGEQAFVAYKKNNEASDKLSMLAFQLLIENKKEDFEIVFLLLKKQKLTVKSIFVFITYFKILPLFIAKRIYFIFKG